MEITLKQVGNGEKTYKAPFVSARMLRKTIEMGQMQAKGKENFAVEDLDIMVDFIVDLFGKQFTRDEVYDGIASKDLLPTLMNCIQEVTGQMAEVTEPLTEKNG